MKTKVYCIGNGADEYRTSEGYWQKFPFCKMFLDKSKAEDELSRIFISNIGGYYSLPVKSVISWKVVEMTLDHDPTDSFPNTGKITDVVMTKEIESANSVFGGFWEHLVKQGTSDKVEYLMRVKSIGKYYTPNKEELKHIRDTIRLLGVKTNQYRSQGYNFAFNSAEEAMNARLCLEVDEFLDVTPIREKAKKIVKDAG